MADPVNPPGSGTPPPQNHPVLNTEDINRLERYKDIQTSVNDILSNYADDLDKINLKLQQYISSLIEQEKETNRLNNSINKLNTEHGLFAANLQTEIKYLNNLNEAYENKLKKSYQENLNLKEKLNNITGETIDTYEDYQKIIERVNRVTDDVVLNFATQIKDLPQLNKFLDEQVKSYLSLSDKEQQELILRVKNISGLNDETAIRQLLIGAEQKHIVSTIKRNEELQKALPLLLSENQLSSLKREKLDEINKAAGRFVDKLAGVGAQSNLFASSMLSMISNVDSFTKSFNSGFMDAFLKPEAAMNRFFNFLNKNLIQSTLEYDKVLADVNKNTGGFRSEFEKIAFNKVGPFAASSVTGLATYGVGVRELGNSFTALNKTINNFTKLSEEQQFTLAKNAATMENLGISAQTYAQTVSKYMGSIGKTADGAREAINRLARDAIAAGRDVGEYVKEFESLMPQLAAYGREAQQIFKELNSLAGMTKGVMSTSDFMKISEQFSTFEGAAESVSKLNAALGGTSVNISELVRVDDPIERLKMLKRALDESGVEFDKLNSGYRKLIAEAFGVDVSKAGAFVKGSLAQAAAEMNKMAASEKEMEERKKKSLDVTQKLTKAIETMRIAFTPLIDFIGYFADGLAKISDTIGGFGTFLLVVLPLGIAGIGGMFRMIGTQLTASLTAPLIGINTQLQATNGTLTSIITQLEAANIASGTLATSTAVTSGVTTGAAAVAAGTSGAVIAGETAGIAGGAVVAQRTGLLARGGNLLKGAGKLLKGGWKGLLVGGTIAGIGYLSSGGGSSNTSISNMGSGVKQYQDGEENIGPGEPKSLFVGNKLHAMWDAGDTFKGMGAKNPNMLNGTNLRSQPIENSKIQNILSPAAKEIHSYAKKISEINNQTYENNKNFTQEIFREFTKIAREQNKKPIILEKVIAKIDPGDLRQIREESAEMGADKALQSGFNRAS